MNSDLRAVLVAMMPRLRRFGLALTGRATDADDLVQNACERALRRGDQLRSNARADAWIYGIMRHLWNDEVRSRRIRRHACLESAGEVVGEGGERVVEGRMTLDAVRRLLSGLPEEQRTVLLLVCVDGLSYREAADVLGTPVGTVMSRLSRGRQELAARLSRQDAGAVPQPVSGARQPLQGA